MVRAHKKNYAKIEIMMGHEERALPSVRRAISDPVVTKDHFGVTFKRRQD